MKQPIFFLGFRIFFASSALYGAIAMMIWLALYDFGLPIPLGDLPSIYWHGHEMVFGYAMAAVAGFLLTAVGNWTGQAMPSGRSLFLIWLPWLLARLIFVVAPSLYRIGIGLDFIFMGLLFYAIAKPIIAIKQWRQMGILSKIVLMMLANALCLAGALGWASGWHYGLYLGVFSIIGLLLTIGRRVTPFFISRGVGYPFEPKNSAMVDRLCLAGFLAFFLVQVFTSWEKLAAVLALITAVCHAWRLLGWYTSGIWKKPLLWSMLFSLWFVVFGLFLYFLRGFWRFPESWAMHAMAVGGIGIMILSMMARVSLGHTGRNIHLPPKVVPALLVCVSLSAVFRVVFPLFFPIIYLWWIAIAQVLWIIAFLLLAIAYLPYWCAPRVDGKPG